MREGALLILLLALGAAPAAFLSARFDATTRLALAPALGFCLGTCVSTTVLQITPAQSSYWILIPVAAFSICLAALRTARSRASRFAMTARDVAQLLIVCMVVTVPLNAVLHSHHTVGPVAYTYTDVDNYVGEEDGARTMSIASARSAWASSVRTGARFADLTAWDWSFFASFNANPNAAPLDANLDELLGLGATDTNAAFLIVLMLSGALGVFAAVRYATRSPTWMAALAGGLFGGPFFLELWFDTFEAAIMALGLLMPLAVVGNEVIRERRAADVVVLALILGCLLTVYPVLVPIVIVAGALVIVTLAIESRRRGWSLRCVARTVAVPTGVLLGLVLAFTNVGFVHVVGYYRKLLENEVPLPRVPWHLSPEILPGWLLQTREFWYLPSLGVGGLKQIILAVLIPLVFLSVMIVAVRRNRFAVALLALGAVCAVFAEYAYSSRNACTYCAERDLLPLAVIGMVLLAIGLAAMLAAQKRWTRWLAGAIVLLAIVAVGQRTHVELRRFSNGSYFLDSADREALARLPPHARAIQLEGFGQTLSAQAEQPLVYYLADEHARGRTSIVLGSNLYGALQYLDFGVVKPPGPEFHPDYDYVLTRFAGINSGRRVITRSGGIALEARTQPLDVLPYSGLAAPLARLDRSGAAWLQPPSPLELYVVGPTLGPVWAKLIFRTLGPVTVTSQPGVRTMQNDGMLEVCVKAVGSPPIRSATLQVTAPPAAGPPVAEAFPPPTPQENIELTSMRAVAHHCFV
ncbi:MAG: hypothetical protein ACLQBB_03580 [Solirubrobacteraceae bacterium]